LLREKIQKIRDFYFKHKKAVLVLLAGLFVFGVIFTYASVELTSTVEFCSSCHEMKPAYESWKKSTHYNVKEGERRASCRDCHVPPWTNPVNVLYTKAYHGIKDVYKHFADADQLSDPGYHEAMRAHAPKGISNSSCLKCHGDIYKKEYPGVVNIHKELKKNSKSRCTDCHVDMVHYPYPFEMLKK
jgi:cytochrome c nitrite reductase small subunit